MENTIGIESGDIVRPMRDYRKPQIVEFQKGKVRNYLRKWLPSEKIKIPRQNIRSRSARTIQNAAIKPELI